MAGGGKLPLKVFESYKPIPIPLSLFHNFFINSIKLLGNFFPFTVKRSGSSPFHRRAEIRCRGIQIASPNQRYHHQRWCWNQSSAKCRKGLGKESDSLTLPKRIHVLLLLWFTSAFSTRPKLSESTRTFTIVNNCKETVWPAVIPADNFTAGGFVLKPGQSILFTAPVSWSGRIWGRTGCNFDKSGNGSCQTGSCGSALQCGASAKPPATLAEFTLAKQDFYDVSLVDGFNLPLVVTPLNGTGNCSVSGCDTDLRPNCPKELAVKANGKNIGCRSACGVFNTDEYCCRGRYGNAAVCKPTYYSKKFKEACPTAYSYAYDDPTSIFTCSGTDYVIAFCSTRKRPMCTYRHHKIPCPNVSGSVGLKSLRWWAVMLGLLMMINLWIIF